MRKTSEFDNYPMYKTVIAECCNTNCEEDELYNILKVFVAVLHKDTIKSHYDLNCVSAAKRFGLEEFLLDMECISTTQRDNSSKENPEYTETWKGTFVNGDKHLIVIGTKSPVYPSYEYVRAQN